MKIETSKQIKNGFTCKKYSDTYMKFHHILDKCIITSLQDDPGNIYHRFDEPGYVAFVHDEENVKKLIDLVFTINEDYAAFIVNKLRFFIINELYQGWFILEEEVYVKEIERVRSKYVGIFKELEELFHFVEKVVESKDVYYIGNKYEELYLLTDDPRLKFKVNTLGLYIDSHRFVKYNTERYEYEGVPFNPYITMYTFPDVVETLRYIPTSEDVILITDIFNDILLMLFMDKNTYDIISEAAFSVDRNDMSDDTVIMNYFTTLGAGAIIKTIAMVVQSTIRTRWFDTLIFSQNENIIKALKEQDWSSNVIASTEMYHDFMKNKDPYGYELLPNLRKWKKGDINSRNLGRITRSALEDIEKTRKNKELKTMTLDVDTSTEAGFMLDLYAQGMNFCKMIREKEK